ncbi:hypothetical protein NHJ13051_006526 [Beauveria bassiana]
MAEMDKAEVSGLKPTKSVKGKKCEVQFDATQPDHLFDAIFGFLFTEQSSEKDVPAHAKIVKHTRDFVLHVENETTAIRRSPIWLFFKVVLQQELRHSKAMSDYTLYKQFMVLFFALLLDSACDRKLDSHTVHCMRRKIGYRMWKLQDKAVGPWMKNVQHALAKANGLLNTRWEKIVKHDQNLQATTLPQFLADATDCTVTHSELDIFLAKVSQTLPQTNNHVADPRSGIISWGPGKLPNMNQLGDESSQTDIFNLIMVETWVEDYLFGFIRAQIKDESTCSDIRSFAMAYFKRAHVVYKDLPDHMSIMYLTLLELWIASDMSAVARNPSLREYTPLGVEDICWEALLLQRKRDLSRLSQAEEYIRCRSVEKMCMMANYGTADCFSSRFVQASAPHMALRATIDRDEDKNVEEKAAELERLIKKQKLHLDFHEKMQCDPTTCRIGTGQHPCERCSHLVVARELTINPYLKTLPDDEHVANAVVFELRPPADISAWRDFCFFLQLNVTGQSKPKGGPSFFSYLHNYGLFEPYAQKNALNSDPRICAASPSPKKGTKDPIQVRQDLKLSEICHPHPMKWRLFDSDEGNFIEDIKRESVLHETCRIELDEGNTFLQKLSCSPTPDNNTLKTANELIAMRLESENTSVLKHNEELGSLYLCNHATWPKILRELRGTSIDWTALETFSVILQVALRAGPKQKQSELRQKNSQLHDDAFSTEILDEILRVLGIYTSSFSGRTALAVFCTIAIKILSEASDACHAKAYHILRIIRNTCFDWMRDCRMNVIDVTSGLFATQLDLALICVYTFNLSNRALKHFLTDTAEGHGEQYIFASTIIQESNSRLTTQFQKSLYSSWLRVAVIAAPILCGQVKRGELGSIINGLEFSLGRATGLSPDADCFCHVSGPWIKTRTRPYPGTVCKIIHLNTMTGEILLDGFSPRHLSSEYLTHKDFGALFGRMSPAVTPSNHPIYQYQFHHAFKGFTIEIGLEKVTSGHEAGKIESHLHLRATKGDLVYVMVPRQILCKQSFRFPKEYLNGYFHWHQVTHFPFQVDLYPYQSPWDCGSIAWQLLKQRSGGWLLKQHGRDRVVMPATVTHYEELSKIFQHFKTEDDFRVILNREKETLEHDRTHRVLVILDGEETVLKISGHVNIGIEIKEKTTVQVYRIDDFLKQLKGNQTWRSKAWLAYLSALTSHPLPDPFTSRTGQETAFEILTSSAILSFDALEANDLVLLQKIGQLSQGRQLRKRGGLNIPIIEWDTGLRPASHHEQYWFAAEKIRDRAERLNIFQKDSKNEPRKTPEAEMRYRESNAIRLACLRTGEYGSHTTAHDADYYFRMPEPESKRTKGTVAAVPRKFDYGSSSGLQRAYHAAYGAKYRRRFNSVLPSPSSILGQMTIAGTIKGVTKHYDAHNFRYTPKWASTVESTLVEDLCSVHNALSKSIEDRNPFRLRLWLSTVASGMEGLESSIIIPILSALVNENHKTGFEIPTTSNTNNSRGTKYSADQIVKVLNEAKCMHQSSPFAIDAQTLQSREKFHQTQDEIISSLAERIAKNGDVDLSPHRAFLNVFPATESIRELLKIWNLNKKWYKYAEHLCVLVSSLEVSNTKPPAMLHVLPKVDTSSATKRMSGYDDSSFPDAVLLEIEQDVCLRSNQLEVARQMRDRPKGENAVMQLNMGEGKSSIIIPILSASLAQGKTLVRVFAGRHQSKQMMDTLITAMGGLMDRPVLCMPFNRDSKLSAKSILKVKESLLDCVNNGGVLLLQPEHHLSLLLSTSLNEEPAATKNYVSLLKYINTTSRDIIDECDELLSPTYELLYTIGTPGPIDLAPDRWLLIQGLLEQVKNYSNPKSKIITPDQVLYQTNPKHPDAFPSFCFLTSASLCVVLTEVAREFATHGFTGFSVSRYKDRKKKADTIQKAIFEYITMAEPPEKTVKEVKKLGEVAKSGLALVRGCIAGDVLRVPLLRKRWRVDYGCDFRRTPPTRLAVPFSAKDVPKPRAEFSNTDVVIIFTQLSYYHSGLHEEHVRDLIEHMLTSDDGHNVYGHWFESSNSNMPVQLQILKAVNLQDDKQFYESFYPNIRYSIKAIDHFLSRLVFPTELGAFSQHMAASGWDLAEVKAHPTTGFSGTTDQCELLPLDMKQLNLPTQAHTNALVLNNILSTENTVLSVHTELEKRSFDGSDLIDHVIKDGQIRVILDVGAQVIKLSNRQVAERWLQQTQDSTIKAVLFCDDSDALSVIDRSGTALPLKVSVYANKLDACAVFLDEAHTRGTDLRLPPNYKAAVTLGPGLTKDRLAQACMRMRNLGNGQTLVFYVSFEVENSIRSLLRLSDEQPLTIDYLIQWSILQTQASITRQIPHWAKQGRRHGEQAEAWKCLQYGISKSSSGDIDETCEREVAPEVEDEKQISKPPNPVAMESFHNRALDKFIETGQIDDELPGLEWAYPSLRRTTLRGMLKKLKFPRTLRVTRDFAQAVDTDDPTDAYQHHVAYVLHIKPVLARHGDLPVVVIITQSDLENHWSAIEKSKMIDLHLYNAKVTPEAARRVGHIYPLNIACSYTHPTTTRIALDLFAGQLYFGSYQEYIEVSSFLGLAYFDETKDIEFDMNGFIPSHERHKIPAWHRHANQYWDTFDVSPVPFLKRFLGVVRSHGAGIEHTHMGRILDGERLGSKEFPDYKARGPEDVEPGVKTDRGARIETKAQRDRRMQMRGKRRREGGQESNAEPALKRPRLATSKSVEAAISRRQDKNVPEATAEMSRVAEGKEREEMQEKTREAAQKKMDKRKRESNE